LATLHFLFQTLHRWSNCALPRTPLAGVSSQ
jgi:hypothetical protein